MKIPYNTWRPDNSSVSFSVEVSFSYDCDINDFVILGYLFKEIGFEKFFFSRSPGREVRVGTNLMSTLCPAEYSFGIPFDLHAILSVEFFSKLDMVKLVAMFTSLEFKKNGNEIAYYEKYYSEFINYEAYLEEKSNEIFFLEELEDLYEKEEDDDEEDFGFGDDEEFDDDRDYSYNSPSRRDITSML